jgi:hypothetical protein
MEMLKVVVKYELNKLLLSFRGFGFDMATPIL